jgi:hypothetical protein
LLGKVAANLAVIPRAVFKERSANEAWARLIISVVVSLSTPGVNAALFVTFTAVGRLVTEAISSLLML